MKIGIVTHYYKSENYGGNLQAYALCRFLQKNGYCVEQISVDIRYKSFFYRIKEVLSRFKNIKTFTVLFDLKKRSKAIIRFNQEKIPHSKRYSMKNIEKCVDEYDAFITGSDQVWHPDVINKAFLLDFVPSRRKKIAYAASIAVNEIPDERKSKYKESLQSYDAISVREEKGIEILKSLTDEKVVCTLDPTLLLTKQDWDEVCDERIINDKYIFCYFLGESKEHRDLAKEYAKRQGVKVVTLPHLLGRYRESDDKFGDFRLYDVSPSGFLSLIKYAETVFTDSFHATVFSIIYKKDFFVLERKMSVSMGSRLQTLTSLFGMEERFCDSDDKVEIDYILRLSALDYEQNFEKYRDAVKRSRDFLIGSLEHGSKRYEKRD